MGTSAVLFPRYFTIGFSPSRLTADLPLRGRSRHAEKKLARCHPAKEGRSPVQCQAHIDHVARLASLPYSLCWLPSLPANGADSRFALAAANQRFAVPEILPAKSSAPRPAISSRRSPTAQPAPTSETIRRPPPEQRALTRGNIGTETHLRTASGHVRSARNSRAPSTRRSTGDSRRRSRK